MNKTTCQALSGWALAAVLFGSAAACSDGSSAASNTGIGGGQLAVATATAAPTTPPTPTPVPIATPKPAPTQAPRATAPPVQATRPPAPPLAPAARVAFVNAPLTASPGQATTLIVRTTANSPCTIVVNYKSGPSHAQGLFAKSADGAGNVSWTWIVGTRTTPGQWTIYVTCGSASNQTYIHVT